MPKLKLQVDGLRVESFETDDTLAALHGTVHARSTEFISCDGRTCDTCGCGDTEFWTCQDSCICPSNHYTECNCGATQELTC